LRDDPIDWNLVLYFVLGTLIFYACSAPIAYLFASGILPETDTGSDFFRMIYYRLYVNTTYVSVGIFVFWIIMYIVGFAFVSVVNLQNVRPNPFISNNGTYKDIKFAVLLAGLLFVLSGMVT
jgi:hypothetical protein